jgi:sugar phosphate isomerase/epimerase
MTVTEQPPEVSSRIRSMRVGFTGSMYAVPESVPAEEKAEWQLRRSAELGATALQVRDLPSTDEGLHALRELASSLDIELEGSARSMFTPFGTAPGSNRDALRTDLQRAKTAGMTVVRSGYGRLTLETSRYARENDPAAQLRHLTACLREAAKVAEEVGLPVAVENHCDFTGRELATVLSDVDSEWVGAAVDTANGFTVYCDPNEDVEALAEFAFTTHMKDMWLEASPMRGLIPLIPRGCRLGEGHVDLPRAVELFAERSPRAERLHLIVEAGWETFDPAGPGAVELKRDLLEHGVRYLNQLTKSTKE